MGAHSSAPFTYREREMSASVRTIESHVYCASITAGVAGRAELADLVSNAPG